MKNRINRSGVDAGGVNLRGRCALVNGAGSGIGRARGVRLATARAQVAALDLDGDAAKRTAQEAGRFVIQSDLAGPGVVDTLKRDADIVVNNAGVPMVAPVQELLPERFALKLRVLEVTLGASFRVGRDVRPGYVRIRWSSWVAR
jgi:3-hydroxybutyrate dehydrogenase